MHKSWSYYEQIMNKSLGSHEEVMNKSLVLRGVACEATLCYVLDLSVPPTDSWIWMEYLCSSTRLFQDNKFHGEKA